MKIYYIYFIMCIAIIGMISGIWSIWFGDAMIIQGELVRAMATIPVKKDADIIRIAIADLARPDYFKSYVMILLSLVVLGHGLLMVFRMKSAKQMRSSNPP